MNHKKYEKGFFKIKVKLSILFFVKIEYMIVNLKGS